MRRAAVLLPLVLAVAGCANNAPPPEVVVPAVPADTKGTALPEPLVGRGVIRGGNGEVRREDPPEPPPPPGAITLPADGGVWPWNLPAAPPPSKSAPVPLDIPKGHVTGVAVAPAVNRAVVTVGDSQYMKPAWTRVILCDIAAGKVVTEWELKEKYDSLDISSDGKRFLLKLHHHLPQEVLHMCTVAPDMSLKRERWQPHDNIDRGSVVAGAIGVTSYAGAGEGEAAQKNRCVAWAAFAGPDRVVTASIEGQLRVWDARTLERLGSIDAAPGRPAVSPDGTRVAFLAPGGVALLDPVAAKVVGTRRFGVPPGDRVLAFSPDGRTLACGGVDRVAYLDLTTGHKWDVAGHQLGLSKGSAPRSFGWVGNSHVLADKYLFGTELPVILWSYSGWDAGTFRGREFWAVTTNLRTKPTVLGISLPHPELVEALEKKKATPGIFALRAGDSVRIDVSGLPADKQADARAALDGRLRQLGYVPNPSGTVVLYATEDTTGTPESDHYLGGLTLKYNARYARLRLEAGGKTLWEDLRTYGGPAYLSDRKSAAQVIDEYGVGRPNYTLFADARIPAMFPGPNFPPGGFGSNVLGPTGLKGDLRPRD